MLFSSAFHVIEIESSGFLWINQHLRSLDVEDLEQNQGLEQIFSTTAVAQVTRTTQRTVAPASATTATAAKGNPCCS